MPTLPSGRRVEFSLDRFHTMLEMLPPHDVELLEESLREPQDLLWVLDLVGFDDAGRPHFAECVAANWDAAALEWSSCDRQAFGDFLRTDAARQMFERGLDGTRQLVMRRMQTPDCDAARRFA